MYFCNALRLTTWVDLWSTWCLKLQFDVTFPALPCSILSLDALDISGEQHLDVVGLASSIFALYVNDCVYTSHYKQKKGYWGTVLFLKEDWVPTSLFMYVVLFFFFNVVINADASNCVSSPPFSLCTRAKVQKSTRDCLMLVIVLVISINCLSILLTETWHNQEKIRCSWKCYRIKTRWHWCS